MRAMPTTSYPVQGKNAVKKDAAALVTPIKQQQTSGNSSSTVSTPDTVCSEASPDAACNTESRGESSETNNKISNELEALRNRALAKNLRKDLQEQSAYVPTRESFFLQQKNQSKEWKKQQEASKSFLNSYRGKGSSGGKSQEKPEPVHPAPPARATSEMNQFYVKQRQLDQELKEKQRAAFDYLHQYRGHVVEGNKSDGSASPPPPPPAVQIPVSPLADRIKLFDSPTAASDSPSRGSERGSPLANRIKKFNKSSPFPDSPREASNDVVFVKVEQTKRVQVVVKETNVVSQHVKDVVNQHVKDVVNEVAKAEKDAVVDMGVVDDVVEAKKHAVVDMGVVKDVVQEVAKAEKHAVIDMGVVDDVVEAKKHAVVDMGIVEDVVGDVVKAKKHAVVDMGVVDDVVEAKKHAVVDMGIVEEVVKAEKHAVVEMGVVDDVVEEVVKAKKHAVVDMGVVEEVVKAENHAVVDMDVVEDVIEEVVEAEEHDVIEMSVSEEVVEEALKLAVIDMGDDSMGDLLDDLLNDPPVAEAEVSTEQSQINVPAEQTPANVFDVTNEVEAELNNLVMYDGVIESRTSMDSGLSTEELQEQFEVAVDDLQDTWDELSGKIRVLLKDDEDAARGATGIPASTGGFTPASKSPRKAKRSNLVTPLRILKVPTTEVSGFDTPSLSKSEKPLSRKKTVAKASSRLLANTASTRTPAATPRPRSASTRRSSPTRSVASTASGYRRRYPSPSRPVVSSGRRVRDTSPSARSTSSTAMSSTASSRACRRGPYKSPTRTHRLARQDSGLLYRKSATKIPKACTQKWILNLHGDRSGCDRCLYFASPEEAAKYARDGHHYRINMVRGGCVCSCKLFPRKEEEEPPVRLCRKCFYDTHHLGKA